MPGRLMRMGEQHDTCQNKLKQKNNTTNWTSANGYWNLTD